MTIDSVFLLTPVETFVPKKGAAAFALTLASAMDAQLTSLVLELDVVTPRSWSIAEGAYAEEDRTGLDNARAVGVADALMKAARDNGVPGEFITEHSHAHTVPRVVVDYARMADISVTGSNDKGLLSELTLAEYILFQSGRPLIVVPGQHDQAFKCDHVVVAWDFSRNAARALGDALPFLRLAKTVSIVTFGDDKELESSLSGEDLVASLADRGIEACYEHAERGARPIDAALNDLARAQDADLLVMGGYGHSRFRELVLGGATRGLLRDPAVPTLLAH
ncbi:universal stress protein [Sphingorhabdus sp.]|uniref:universal stress protein n=1 Tax=Sphingorhabdus sp. TaxID=1902408 RepID=UPI0035AE21A2